jgi:hypothetical protein
MMSTFENDRLVPIETPRQQDHPGEGPIPEGMNPKPGDVIELSDGRTMSVIAVHADRMEVWFDA